MLATAVCPVVVVVVVVVVATFLVAFDTVVVEMVVVVACTDNVGYRVAAACAATKCYQAADQPRQLG